MAKQNKHIKAVTRDRASAYAKVISEELSDAMQIADRFHLHQNLNQASFSPYSCCQRRFARESRAGAGERFI